MPITERTDGTFTMRTKPRDQEAFQMLKEYYGRGVSDVLRMLVHQEARRIEERQQQQGKITARAEA